MKKVAIVTGASRGIGRAVAKRLVQDRFAVVVNYLSNAAQAEKVVTELKGIGGNAVPIQADVSSPHDVERLFNETSAKFGSIDVVVHNSGIMPLSPITKNDANLFDKVISNNLRGAFLALAQAAQHIASGGRIIAFSSSVLTKNFPSYGPYIASKDHGQCIHSSLWPVLQRTKRGSLNMKQVHTKASRTMYARVSPQLCLLMQMSRALRTLSSRSSMLPLASDRSVCTTIQPRTGRKWSIWFWTVSVPSFFVGSASPTY
jgi:NADP-dependent 3-hydroxy acid dehydrogenase YdfG